MDENEYRAGLLDQKDEKIQELTEKVQHVLNTFYPERVTCQYMFPDGDVWIVRPEMCHFCEAKTLETQRLPICEGCARQLIEPDSK